MILRVKTVNSIKINVGDIRKMKICSAFMLLNGYTPIRAVSSRIDRVTDQNPESRCPIKGHNWIDLQRYEMQDFLENKGTRYVVAYHKNQEDLFILKRANQEKCKKYKRKIERRQARKLWFDTYDSIIKIVIPIITFIMGLVIGAIKRC